MGLFSNIDPGMAQALMAAGFSMMGAPRGREWEALGRAGLFGMDTLGRYGQSKEEQKLRDLQMRQLETALRKAQEELAQQEQVRSLAPRFAQEGVGPPSPSGAPVPSGFDYRGYTNTLAGINPAAALGMEKELQSMTAKDGGAPIDKFKPEHYTPESLARFMQTRNPADLKMVEKAGERWLDVGKTPDGQIIQREANTGQLRAVGSPAARTTVNVSAGETAYDKTRGEFNAKIAGEIQQAGRQASSKLNQLAAMDVLLKGVETSPLTPIGMQAAGIAKAFGADVDPTLPAKQAAETIANRMALDSRQTAEGGGMPGAMSDQDREFLRNMNPNLSQTAEGRALVIEVQRRTAKRLQQVAALARQYEAKHKRLDAGFDDELAAWSNANPLFADLRTQPASTPAATPTTPRRVPFSALPKG